MKEKKNYFILFIFLNWILFLLYQLSLLTKIDFSIHFSAIISAAFLATFFSFLDFFLDSLFNLLLTNLLNCYFVFTFPFLHRKKKSSIWSRLLYIWSKNVLFFCSWNFTMMVSFFILLPINHIRWHYQFGTFFIFSRKKLGKYRFKVKLEEIFVENVLI